MITSLLSLSFFLTSQSQCEIRFMSADACKFETSVETNLTQIRDHLMRSRELAIQSSNGTLGATDRGYLDAEFTARKEEMQRIVRQSIFTDSFQSSYFYLKDGLSFATLVHSNISQADFVYHAEVKPISDSLGSYAHKLFQIKNPTSSSMGYLQIGNFAIPSTYYIDTVSYDARQHSAIMIGGAINSKAGSTLVMADVQENRLSLQKIDFSQFPIALAAGQFKINGVSVTTSLSNVGNLIAAINDISNSTGVKAQLASGTIDIIEVVASDGRNITLEVTKEVASGIGLKLQPDVKNTFAGALILRSAKPFKLVAHDYAYLGFDGSVDVQIDDGISIYSSSLLTQRGAQEALTPIDQSLYSINSSMAAITVLHNGCRGAL